MNTDLSPDEPSLLQIEENEYRLRIAWDNRKLHKNRLTIWVLGLFWVVWAPVTVWATAMIFRSDSPIIFTFWCLFGWTGTILIPITFARLWWREWIELDAETISWGATGFLASRYKSLPLELVDEFGFGHYLSNDEVESVTTLNIFGQPNGLKYRSRYMLAYWLAAEHQESIFNLVRAFVERRSIGLKLVRQGPA